MQINKNLKVLIVDDCQSMRSTVRAILKDLGFLSIAESSDGVQALAKLKQDRYDLLITDWNMPNLDGLSLIRIIKSDAALKDILILMVTTEGEEDHVADAIKIGVRDYILKPFTSELLEKKIAALFPPGKEPG
ncbi:MAG: response regulator [Thermodesulfovibrio sp.]|nr:response regulator [Thermodesulfovibrio sp.]